MSMGETILMTEMNEAIARSNAVPGRIENSEFGPRKDIDEDILNSISTPDYEEGSYKGEDSDVWDD